MYQYLKNLKHKILIYIVISEKCKGVGIMNMSELGPGTVIGDSAILAMVVVTQASMALRTYATNTIFYKKRFNI